jgi:CRP-like cAMP-binding protein
LKEKQALQSILSNVKLFKEAKESDKFKDVNSLDFYSRLSDCLEYKFYSKGQALFHKGDFGDKMFVVLKGRATLYLGKKADDLIAASRRRTEMEAPKQPIVEQRLWDIFIELVNVDNATKYSQALFDSFNKRIIHPYDLFTMIVGRYSTYVGEDLMRMFYILEYRGGSIFGEVALTHSQPRLGSIVVVDDCHTAELSAKDYETFFSGKAEEEKTNKEFLKSVFKLPPDVMNLVPYHFTTRQVQLHDILYEEGACVDLIFIVQSGIIQVITHVISYSRESMPQSLLGLKKCLRLKVS